MNTTFTFKGGKIVSNFETLGAVATKTWTVPTGKRWVPMGLLYAERDANATFDAKVTDGSDKPIIPALTTQIAAGVTNLGFPKDCPDDGSIAAFRALKGMVLKAGWKVVLTWGAAQTTPEISFPVLEIDET